MQQHLRAMHANAHHCCLFPFDLAETTPNEAVTSQLGQEEETGAADVDSEETEDDCADKDMDMDSDDSDDSDDDCCAPDTTTSSASSAIFGCPDKQEPCDQDDGNELASVASSPTAAEDVVTSTHLAPVKTECGAVPLTTFRRPSAASTTASEPVSSSSAVNGNEAEHVAGIPSSVVKTEAITSLASAAVSREATDAKNSSTSPAPKYSHQLSSPCKLAWWEHIVSAGKAPIPPHPYFPLVFVRRGCPTSP